MSVQPTANEATLDGVFRHSPSGIKVLVVGAGPGGLLAAIECWRKGHDVEVVEKWPGPSTIGDIIALGPSAWSTLRFYPSMLEEYAQVIIDAQIVPCHQDGQQATSPFEFEFNREGVAQHAAHPLRIGGIIGRADLANLFYNQCQRLKIPITWNVSITGYEEDLGTESGRAISSDGKSYSADIVIAADGIGSKSHELIQGHPIPAVSTGYVIYRAAMPTQGLQAPRLRELLKTSERPQMRAYVGHNQHIIMVVSERLISFAMTLPEGGRGVPVESWSSTITAGQFMEEIQHVKDIDPVVSEVISQFPENGIVAWKLCMRNPQRNWTSKNGHVVQLGDSAHTYIPTSMNGATMALEDAISLAECLRLGGREGGAMATKVHHLLRYERTTLVQRMGLRNRVAFHAKTTGNIQDLAKLAHQGKWLWSHNAEKYAFENFTSARKALEDNTYFENTNIPPGYKSEEWTLDSEIEKEAQGSVTDLTTTGDWTVI